MTGKPLEPEVALDEDDWVGVDSSGAELVRHHFAIHPGAPECGREDCGHRAEAPPIAAVYAPLGPAADAQGSAISSGRYVVPPTGTYVLPRPVPVA